MSYRIEWLSTARRHFAAEFDELDLSEQRRVVDALSDLDFQLMNLPLDSGESRDSPTSRVLVAGPVIAFYRVDAAEHLVEIIAAKTVWRAE